jgi:hypothetical protein
MAYVYSVQLFLGDYDTSDGPLDLFTCAAGYTTVIREISGYFDGIPSGQSMYIAIPGLTTFPILDIPMDAFGCFTWQGRLTLNAGQGFEIADALGGAHGSILVGGYQLTLP